MNQSSNALQQLLTADVNDRTGYKQQIQDSLDELLCSPALAAARSCHTRLQQIAIEDSAACADRLLMEEDALRQVIDQIRHSELLDWREAEHRAHTAAHRQRVEQPRITIVGRDIELTALDEHYQREAMRCAATEQMLIEVSDRAECLVENARHWRRAAFQAVAPKGVKAMAAAQSFKTCREYLESAAALIARGYLGDLELAEHFLADGCELQLPAAAGFLKAPGA